MLTVVARFSPRLQRPPPSSASSNIRGICARLDGNSGLIHTEFTGIGGCCQGEIVPATSVVSLIYDLVVLYFLEQQLKRRL